ncbi:c-type cytochrome biogenesis protein CcmI [Agarivorans sp. QJM3NY_33]|uniref:c-type cytochrome biogenesis protein CcmI n=1 Tax=Agarivorans sp. QJM3NY_33 TaxID=3421432 RepID=UPI003D7EB35E
MIVFWLAVVALTLLALAAVVLPLWLRRQQASLTQTDLNKALYKDRLLEIEQENQQGLADDREQLVTELQHNLLDDIPESSLKAETRYSAWVLLVSLVFVATVPVGLYYYLGSAKQVQHWQSIIQQMPELSNKVLLAQGGPVSEQELTDFALGLRTKLYQDPNDSRGWFLLAKVGQAMNRLDVMTDAAEKAYALDADSPNVLVVYLQSLFYSGDAMAKARAERLLVAALQKMPNQLELWSLYSFLAVEQQQYSLAIERWQKMLSLVDSGSERAQMLNKNIQFAQAQIAQQSQAQAQQQSSLSTETPTSEPNYSVTVNLQDGLVAPESSFLFVFAKAVNGPPMPLAAKRIAHPKFPLTVTLSDKDSMMEGLKLSQQAEFYITARLSYDNNAQTTTGDWEGKSSTISQGSDLPISLLINTPL